jgi:nucleotide-binding universal stress UspA family protein
MFDHVIVGIDGTDGGLDAVALARLLGARRLTLVSAYPGDPAPAPDDSQIDDTAVRGDALDDLEDARAAAGVPAELWPVAEHSPARALHHVAAATGADLISIGSSRHSPPARVLRGDVGGQVLDGAPCPVVVAPRGYADHGSAPVRVAVGYTGTPESDAALALAADWAHEHGAALRVDIAWDVPPRILAGGDAKEYAAASHRAAQWAMGRAFEFAHDATVDVTDGPAHEVLLDAARRADLLVLGSRGWGPAGAVCLGRSGERLVHHTPAPLMVVPRPAAPVRAPQRVRLPHRLTEHS